jgi:hypothetical protein
MAVDACYAPSSLSTVLELGECYPAAWGAAVCGRFRRRGRENRSIAIGILSLMRKTLVALGVIGLVWIGYTAWPLSALTELARAIDARDLPTAVRHINFDRVRVSLTEQIITAYFRRTGTKPSPLAQQALAAGASLLSPVVNKLVSPEAFSEFLAVGWPVAVAGNPPPGTIGINRETVGTAWQIFGASHYGIGRFEVAAPIELPSENRFRLRFHLIAWRWQLTGVILPEHIQNLVADEVMKAVRERR